MSCSTANGRRSFAWKETLPAGGRFQKLPDGCVELATENNDQLALASVAVAGPGLHEVIAQVDDATPGTGIALLNAKGEPVDGIEFGRIGATKLAFGFGNPREPPYLGNHDFNARPVPLGGPRKWLRLVVAAGTSKCWVSGDGVHWGRVLDNRDRIGAWKTIALYAREVGVHKTPDNVARHIRLRFLQVRELSGLTAAVPADLRAAASAAEAAMKTEEGESPQAWLRRIDRLAPQGCSSSGWRYACTLRALAAAVQPSAADWALSGLYAAG